jgi:hypothetical protein
MLNLIKEVVNDQASVHGTYVINYLTMYRIKSHTTCTLVGELHNPMTIFRQLFTRRWTYKQDLVICFQILSDHDFKWTIQHCLSRKIKK